MLVHQYATTLESERYHGCGKRPVRVAMENLSASALP